MSRNPGALGSIFICSHEADSRVNKKRFVVKDIFFESGTLGPACQELLLLNYLEHEHIIKVVEYMRSQPLQRYFIVTEYVELVNKVIWFCLSVVTLRFRALQ